MASRADESTAGRVRQAPSGGGPRGIRPTQEAIVAAASALLFVVFSLTVQGFLTAENIFTLLRNVSVLGILSLGMAVAVVGRGIDLSIVAMMAISTTWSIVLAQSGVPFPLALLAGLAFVVAFSALIGFLVAYVEIPSIFATLAMGAVIYGLGRGFLVELDVNYLPNGLDWFVFLGRGTVLGVPTPVLCFGLLALIFHVALRYTGFGRFVYAIGDNLMSARITGIPVRPVVVSQHVISGVSAFLAGLVAAAAVTSTNTRIYNSTLIYDVLLVVVLGGIGLSGGKGGVRNVLVGTLLIGLLLNGMTILDVQYTVQNLIKSAVLLAAIATDALVNPRDEQTSQQGDI